MVRRNKNLCVKVAKDVVAQLRAKRYQATTGKYVEVDTSELSEDIVYADEYYDMSFKDLFKKNKEMTCEVCALGSAFVSLVNIKNECSIGEMTDAIDNSNMFDRLEELFGGENMSLMESAFEECETLHGDFGDSVGDEIMAQVAGEWGSQYHDDDQRLRAIMLNVIRNGGDFKLPKSYLKEVKSRIAEYEESESTCGKDCEICFPNG